MKKQINDLLLKMQKGENCIGETANKLLNLYNASNCAIKPPLGLVPKWVRQKERYEEVCQAIARYYNANREIPTEWIEEYNELVKHCC